MKKTGNPGAALLQGFHIFLNYIFQANGPQIFVPGEYSMTAKTGRQTEDGYALIENMLVLPIVFLVVYALLFAGFILHAQCTIESAARRGMLYAGHLICDPQYERVTAAAVDPGKGELNEISGEAFNFTFDPGISYKPYRYILSRGYYTDNDEKIKSYVRKILDQNTTWMFKIEDSGIVCKTENVVLTQNVRVKITAKYPLPRVFTWLGIADSYDLEAEAAATVIDQDEFIRNVDYVEDLFQDVVRNTGIGEAIGEPLKKLKGFMDKLFK